VNLSSGKLGLSSIPEDDEDNITNVENLKNFELFIQKNWKIPANPNDKRTKIKIRA
jgi:hypothetical protein